MRLLSIHKIIIWCLFLLIFAGCTKREPARSVSPADTTTTDVSTPPKPREPVFDDRYLQRQANRSREVQEELKALRATTPKDTTAIRKLVLRRKGELMFALRDLRAHQGLAQAVRDSMSAPLDSEAIELAEILLDLDKK